MILSLSALLTLSLVGCFSVEPTNFHYLPGLNEKSYSRLGDINIGAMVFLYEQSDTRTAETCSNSVIMGTYELESTETIAFAVDLINRDPNILPNITLGFVIRGICTSTGVVLGTSLPFIPRNRQDCNNSTCSSQDSKTSDRLWLSHDVFAMVGVGYSHFAVPLSSLYAVAHLPIIGAGETSDDLSNKKHHPYFFRVVPPDMYLVDATLKFVSANGWSYISVIYDEGSFGQKAFDRVFENVGQYGICVATSYRLIHPAKYDEVVSDLLLNPLARVVIIFIMPKDFRQILHAVEDKNATRHFIWVGQNSLIYSSEEDSEISPDNPYIGKFAVDFYSSYVPDFFDYLQQQRVSTTVNPWLKPWWEYLFDCSHDDGTCDTNVSMLQSPKYNTVKENSLRIDAVLTIARAAHALLSEKCPDARGTEARACITGELIREYLKNTSFDGVTGPIEFDQNQDVKGKYIINQIVYDHYKSPFFADTNTTGKKTLTKKQIGIYDIETKTLTYNREHVSWSHLKTLDPFQEWRDDLMPAAVPQSKCSVPCGAGEYKIEKSLSCCWECRKCRENERLVKDNTSCEPCPSFMWPDFTSGFTTCLDIPLTYPMFKDPIPIVFTSLAIIALITTTAVMASYFIYRDQRVIKASSRELSVIQLFAIFIGYTTVILFQTKPSDTMCGVIFFLFCMSFSLLYCPLLVKTVRICRIFKSAKNNEKPSFISPTSQVFFATLLIVIQASLCIAVYILFWPKARRTQPIWSEKLVELSCDLTFPGILTFLGYNIVLVSLCSVFAFMVRSLPDNFNESKFISMCVTTTLLIFMAFIPAYFTADRQFIRVFLLSVALFLNHSVALMFLFMPKIYAARFLPPETGDFSKNRS